MKKCNAGFALIELLIGMAIVTVVGGLITTFLLFSTKHYGSSSKEASLQEDAQIVLSQLDDYIIDTNGAIFYYVNTGDGPEDGTATLSDSSYTGTGTDFKSKRIKIYKTSETGNTLETIIWTKNTQELTYQKASVDSNGLVVSILDATQLLAENIEDFSVDLTETETSSKVTLALNIAKQDQTYETESIIALRNKVKVNELAGNGTFTPVNPTVTFVHVTPDAVTLHKGDIQRFRATVSGNNDPSQDVTWTVENSTSLSGTTGVDANGSLFVANDEASATLGVRATSVEDPTKSAVAQVTVKEPVTYHLEVSPTSATVKQGEFLNATAKLVDSEGYVYSDSQIDWTANLATLGSFSNRSINGNSIKYTVGSDVSGVTITLTATTIKDGNNYSEDIIITVPNPYDFIIQCNTGYPDIEGNPYNINYNGDIVHTDSLLELNAGIMQMLYNSNPVILRNYSYYLWGDNWNPGCSSTQGIYFSNMLSGGTGKIGSDNKILNQVIVSDRNLEITGGLLENGGTPSILYSRYGNITIYSSQVNFTGLIYAPNGTVTLRGSGLTINGAIIAKKVTGGVDRLRISKTSAVAELIKTLSEVE